MLETKFQHGSCGDTRHIHCCLCSDMVAHGHGHVDHRADCGGLSKQRVEALEGVHTELSLIKIYSQVRVCVRPKNNAGSPGARVTYRHIQAVCCLLWVLETKHRSSAGAQCISPWAIFPDPQSCCGKTPLSTVGWVWECVSDHQGRKWDLA